jgi:uncharacterized protein YndB with AHSA1/START domain
MEYVFYHSEIILSVKMNTMENNLTVTVAVDIKSTPTKVWEALTSPRLIKKYLFGTDTKTDWKKGSPITYTGEYNGKHYVDKGKIIDVEPEHLLHTTYLSGMSHQEDKPENYANVIYELSGEKGYTRVTLTQDNIPDQKTLKHMEENWNKVLEGMKEVVEKEN